MPRRTAEPHIKPFEIRPGLGIARLRGMNRTADPGSIPADQFHLQTNVRLTPSTVRERPGLTPEHDSGVDDCITAMVEFEDEGVGLWISRGFNSDNFTLLMNFDEQADVPASFHLTFLTSNQFKEGWKALIWTLARRLQPWQTLVRLGDRVLAIGARSTPNESFPAGPNQVRFCLYEITFPSPGIPTATRTVFLDITEDLISGGQLFAGNITGMVSRVNLAADNLSANTFLQPELFLGTQDGEILSYDGEALRYELQDMGIGVIVHLITHNEVAIFAIGTDFVDPIGTPAASVHARYQSAFGEAWITPTVPQDIMPLDLFSFGGKVYIVASDEQGTGDPPTHGARIYVYDGGAAVGAHTFEFPFVDVFNGYTYAGLFFTYLGQLYIIGLDADVGALGDHFIWQRDTDSSWIRRFGAIMTGNDEVRWVLTTGGRVYFGGFEDGVGHVINEFDMNTGLVTNLYSQTAAFEIVSAMAIALSPDDSLDEEL